MELFPKDQVSYGDRQFSPIHKSLMGLCPIKLIDQLATSTTAIDDKDDRGRTTLYWACLRGDRDAVETLLFYQADPNRACEKGETPLIIACRLSLHANGIVRLLLDNNADVSLADNFNRNALYWACALNENSMLQTLLSFKPDTTKTAILRGISWILSTESATINRLCICFLKMGQM